AKPGRLNGGRPAREGQQTVADRVSRQVDEDVDGVGADQVGKGCLVELIRGPPTGREGLEAMRILVRAGADVIAGKGPLPAIQVGQGSEQEEGDRVAAE